MRVRGLWQKVDYGELVDSGEQEDYARRWALGAGQLPGLGELWGVGVIWGVGGVEVHHIFVALFLEEATVLSVLNSIIQNKFNK